MGELLSAEDVVVLIKHPKSDDEGGSLQPRRKRWSMHLWLLLLLDILTVAKQPAGKHGQFWSQLHFPTSWHMPRAAVASLRSSTAEPRRNVNRGSQQGRNCLFCSLDQRRWIYIGISSCPHILPADTWLNWDTRKDFCSAFCLCFLASLISLLIIPYILLPCSFIFVLWEAWYLVTVLGHEGKIISWVFCCWGSDLHTTQSQKAEILQLSNTERLLDPLFMGYFGHWCAGRRNLCYFRQQHEIGRIVHLFAIFHLFICSKSNMGRVDW